MFTEKLWASCVYGIGMLISILTMSGLCIKRTHYKSRLAVSVGFSAAILVGATYLYSCGFISYTVLYCAICYSSCFILILCFRGRAFDYLYIFFGAYILFHGADALGNIFSEVIFLAGGIELTIGIRRTIRLVSIFVFLIPNYLFMGRKLHKYRSQFQSAGMLFPYLLSSIILYLISALQEITCIVMPRKLLLIYLLRFFFCSVITYLQYLILYRIYSEKAWARESENKAVLTQLWKESAKQYQLLKENIELINIRCHDLKHLAHLLKSGTPDEALFRELTETADVYNHVIQTGNEALDVILTSHSLKCQKNGIQIICMADGESLQFMDVADIYALFGNIMENAVNYVSSLPAEKRYIRLHAAKHEDFILIHQDNYLAEIPETDHGLPLTTHSDTKVHGYGLKSIHLIAEKYNGNLNIHMHDHLFQVDVLLCSSIS